MKGKPNERNENKKEKRDDGGEPNPSQRRQRHLNFFGSFFFVCGGLIDRRRFAANRTTTTNKNDNTSAERRRNLGSTFTEFFCLFVFFYRVFQQRIPGITAIRDVHGLAVFDRVIFGDPHGIHREQP